MIRLYNTLTRKTEEFVPITPGEVRFYSCGPTVYHYAHIGNLRAYVFADILKRMLTASGYLVKHIMNITDVGHLTSDADTGEDKMEKGSAREGKSVWDVAKFYTEAFLRDAEKLNIIPPMKYTRATDFIAEQIAMVKRLEELGYTYRIDDGIYYDVSKFPDYAKLGRQSLDELKAGARVDFAEGKRGAADFALWKFSPKGEKRQMEWDSPWGAGFPGWHLECSAMSIAELGERLDIHSGGVDHIKVHHTNEIAQSEAYLGHKWANYWVHVEFLNDKTGKMSKSKGDFLTLPRLEEMGYKPVAYRYFLLLASYRTQIEFSFEALDAAGKAYENIVKKIARIAGERPGRLGAADSAALADLKNRALAALQDDLDTPRAITILQEALRRGDAAALEFARYVDELLGLTIIKDAEVLNAREQEGIPAEVEALALARAEAKRARDFAKADKLRAEIESLGYAVEDSKNGAKISRK